MTTAATRRRVKVEPATAAEQADKIRLFKGVMTIALGSGIPLLSLAMAKTAGTLATHCLSEGSIACGSLAIFAFCLMVVVLWVSLPHLKWAIQDITRSEDVPSWCLAVALDLSIVLCEMVHVWASHAALGLLLGCVMLAVVAASMTLNCWAFFKGPSH